MNQHQFATAHRVLQLSDCHYQADPEQPYRGVSPDRGLQAMLRRALDWQADLIVVSGDLSNDFSSESYRRIARHLRAPGIPVAVIAGNHDRPQDLIDHVAGDGISILRDQQLGRWQLYGLLTQRDDTIHGELDADQLGELDGKLANNPEPSLVFLHHQPLRVGTPWIDRYRLDDEDARSLRTMLMKHPHVKGVCWGHVHQFYSTRIGPTRYLACPATSANNLPGGSEYQRDETGPAGLGLILDDRGRLEVEPVYASGDPANP